MSRQSRKKGTIWMFGGLLLLAAALFLTLYNLYDANRAEKEAMGHLQELLIQMEEEKEEKNGITESVPDYELYPEMEMPTIEMDGERYIGVIEIPDLSLQLPVLGGEWSYEKLKIAPCRYDGSVYEDDFILAAHNYSGHFGKIKNLSSGAEVRFTDAKGNVFEYVVGWIETIKGTDSTSMPEGEEEWDLTLFTCTYSGSERYTVRCIRQK